MSEINESVWEESSHWKLDVLAIKSKSNYSSK
jgi:hypothetical protein